MDQLLDGAFEDFVADLNVGRPYVVISPSESFDYSAKWPSLTLLLRDDKDDVVDADFTTFVSPLGSLLE